jgi:hypothetical protein
MTTSRILACYQTRKTPDFAPTQQFAMDRQRLSRAGQRGPETHPTEDIHDLRDFADHGVDLFKLLL